MTSRETLPQGLFNQCLDILKKLAASDRDLIRIVVEIISDMRDPFTDEPVRHVYSIEYTLTPSTLPRLMLIRMRLRLLVIHLNPVHREKKQKLRRRRLSRWTIAACSSRVLCWSGSILWVVNQLEIPDWNVYSTSDLWGEFDSWGPNVWPDSPFNTRQRCADSGKGFRCLRIVLFYRSSRIIVLSHAQLDWHLCLQKRALNSVDFFRSQILSSPDQMKSKLYQIIIDMLMVHDQAFVDTIPQKVCWLFPLR